MYVQQGCMFTSGGAAKAELILGKKFIDSNMFEHRSFIDLKLNATINYAFQNCY